MFSVRAVILKYGGPTGRGIGPLSWDVAPGECVGLLGPSGCGKSTMLRVIAGLLPRTGSDYFQGQIQWHSASDGMERVSLMFQQSVLLPHLTVVENILLPFLGDAVRRRNALGDAQRLLGEMGLAREGALLPEHLSGGMRTRVALARALVVRPKLLLLDEPFAGLDVGIRESAYQAIERYRERDGSTIVLVSHDIEEAWRLCERVVIMNSNADTFAYVPNVRQGAFAAFRDQVLAAVSNAPSAS